VPCLRQVLTHSYRLAHDLTGTALQKISSELAQAHATIVKLNERVPTPPEPEPEPKPEPEPEPEPDPEPVVEVESSTDEDILPPEDDLMDVSDVTYSIQIQTSSDRGSGTHANIWLDLCGELGDTGGTTAPVVSAVAFH
jgi:hypothetical protein